MDKKRRNFIKFSIFSILAGSSFLLVKNIPTRRNLHKLSQAILNTKEISLDSLEHKKYVALFRSGENKIFQLIRDDFNNNRIIDVNGWQLSKTECHYILYIQYG